MKCKLLNHRMHQIELFTQKNIENVGFFYVLRLKKKKRSTRLISYISYDSICPQHLSSRKFDFIILIYDRPIKKGTLTAVVIQTVLYTRVVAFFTQIRTRVLEKLVGFFEKDFLSIPQHIDLFG